MYFPTTRLCRAIRQSAAIKQRYITGKVCYIEGLPFTINLIKYMNLLLSPIKGGPDSSVGIATGYGLDGPGIESRWGRDFPHLSRPTLGPTQPPVRVQWVPGLSWG